MQRFLAGGWKAVVVDVHVTGAPAGPDVLVVATDVRIVEQCDGALRAAIDWGGRIDLLVNAAGVWLEGPVEDVAVDDWDRVIDVNLKGTFLMCRAAIPALRATGGSIVNMASDAGLRPTGVPPCIAHRRAVSCCSARPSPSIWRLMASASTRCARATS